MSTTPIIIFQFLSHHQSQIDIMLYFYKQQKTIISFQKVKNHFKLTNPLVSYQLRELCNHNIIKHELSKITNQKIGYSITSNGILYAEIHIKMKEKLKEKQL